MHTLMHWGKNLKRFPEQYTFSFHCASICYALHINVMFCPFAPPGQSGRDRQQWAWSFLQRLETMPLFSACCRLTLTGQRMLPRQQGSFLIWTLCTYATKEPRYRLSVPSCRACSFTAYNNTSVIFLRPHQSTQETATANRPHRHLHRNKFIFIIQINVFILTMSIVHFC